MWSFQLTDWISAWKRGDYFLTAAFIALTVHLRYEKSVIFLHKTIKICSWYISAHVAADLLHGALQWFETGSCWEPFCVPTKLPLHPDWKYIKSSFAYIHPTLLFEMKYGSHLLNWSHREAESGKVIGQSICRWQVSFTQELIVQHARAVLLNKYGLCFWLWLHDTSFFTPEWAFCVIDKCDRSIYTWGKWNNRRSSFVFQAVGKHKNSYVQKGDKAAALCIWHN